jgi:urease gamma subunit
MLEHTRNGRRTADLLDAGTPLVLRDKQVQEVAR